MGERIATSVISGDISRIKSNALITAINSEGLWFGGIDGVIKRAAGSHFHDQARNSPLLADGRAIVAYGRPGLNTSFSNVVFAVDDLERPLREIILAGLLGADAAGFRTITLPTIRLGVMLGAVEKNLEDTIAETAAGVMDFLKEQPKAVRSITFVVYDDPTTELLLRTALSS